MRFSLIKDDECDFPVQFLGGYDFSTSPNNSPYRMQFENIKLLTPVARLTASIKHTLGDAKVSTSVLATYDDHFQGVMVGMPLEFQINSDSFIDPVFAFPTLCLQVIRFHLYRHNLSPRTCGLAERLDALKRCASVAQDTVRYIERMHQTQSHGEADRRLDSSAEQSWLRRVKEGSNSFLCLHLWRCTLILCFQGQYQSALALLQMSKVIGNVRVVNVACGLYLRFFMELFRERMVQSGYSLQRVEQDEELLAYVSADLQNSADSSWVWPSREDTRIESDFSDGSLRSEYDEGHVENLHDAPNFTKAHDFQHSDEKGGDGRLWDDIEQMIVRLQEEHRNAAQTPSAPQPNSHSGQEATASGKSPFASKFAQSDGRSAADVVSPGASSRISIANII